MKLTNNTSLGDCAFVREWRVTDTLFKILLPLMILALLFVAPYSKVAAVPMTCDIQDYSWDGPGIRKLCRPVPDYYIAESAMRRRV